MRIFVSHTVRAGWCSSISPGATIAALYLVNPPHVSSAILSLARYFRPSLRGRSNSRLNSLSSATLEWLRIVVGPATGRTLTAISKIGHCECPTSYWGSFCPKTSLRRCPQIAGSIGVRCAGDHCPQTDVFGHCPVIQLSGPGNFLRGNRVRR